jgi:hypothetical protein
MTPFEAWVGEKPNVGHLRTFGCVAYAHVAKDERKKFDVKTRKCVFLGYGTKTKGYRLYDPKRAKVFFSRDVVFNEKKCGIEKEPHMEEENRYVQIECLGNDEQVDEDTGEPPQPTIEEQPEPVLRRSERERQPPDYYGVRVNVASEVLNEPTSMTEALAAQKEQSGWIQWTRKWIHST